MPRASGVVRMSWNISGMQLGFFSLSFFLNGFLSFGSSKSLPLHLGHTKARLPGPASLASRFFRSMFMYCSRSESISTSFSSTSLSSTLLSSCRM